MHIGLIGGIGPAATSFYYEQLVRAFSDQPDNLQLTIGHSSAPKLSNNFANGLANDQAIEFKRITHQLKSAGAELVAITSMGGHFCATEFAAMTPLPMVNGPVAVGEYLTQLGAQRIAVLGTGVVMRSNLYGALDNLDVIIPPEEKLEQVNKDYIAMAIAGEATEEQRQRMLEIGNQLIRMGGADVLLLGGTDLNLVFASEIVEYPIIDSAQVHVDAIVDAANTPP